MLQCYAAVAETASLLTHPPCSGPSDHAYTTQGRPQFPRTHPGFRAQDQICAALPYLSISWKPQALSPQPPCMHVAPPDTVVSTLRLPYLCPAQTYNGSICCQTFIG